MTPYERLQARIAAVRARLDAGGPARLPTWRTKKKPPTGGGETRSRAPGGEVSLQPAKPPDAPGRDGTLPTPAPGAAVLPLFKHQVDEPLERPKVRGDCEGGERPCPYVGCRHHNALVVFRTGAATLKDSPTVRLVREPETMAPEESCALDMADSGPKGLDAIGRAMGLTRQRVEQIEKKALERIARAVDESLVPKKFKKQCTAINAADGRRCGLLEHTPDVHHRSVRGEFSRVAEPGQTRFEERERFETVAFSNPGEEHGHG